MPRKLCDSWVVLHGGGKVQGTSVNISEGSGGLSLFLTLSIFFSFPLFSFCLLFSFFLFFFSLWHFVFHIYICVRLYTPGSLCFVLICCSVCWDVMLFIWQTLLFFRGCFWVICHFAYIIFLITLFLFCNSSHISSIWIPLWFRVKGCGKLPLAYVTKSMEYINTFSLRQFATNQQLSHAKPTVTL